jgi:hypothetical protein
MARMIRCTVCNHTHKPLYARRYTREFKKRKDFEKYIKLLRSRGKFDPMPSMATNKRRKNEIVKPEAKART